MVDGERLRHLRKVLRVTEGDELKVGLLDGPIGSGRVLSVDADRCELEIELGEEPPAPLSASLVLALPRPKFLGRILQSIASMGVKRLLLVDTARVERSFWQSSLLQRSRLRRHLMLGLAQGTDTVLPRLEVVRRFRDLVEFHLPELLAHSLGLLAHVHAESAFPVEVQERSTIIVGPEGGFLDREVEQLESVGAEARSLGPRPLKTETAVAVLLGRVRIEGGTADGPKGRWDPSCKIDTPS